MTREEAIEILKKYKDESEEDYYIKRAEALNMAIQVLENQKTGHWIRWYEEVEHETYTEGILHCKCSECNKEYDTHTSLFIKYCSNCGAKMKGE